LQRVGFELERRPFKPHLTLVRLKSSRNLSKLQQFLKLEGGEVSLGSFGVQAIHLYQSILRPEGATYRKLATCAL
jgi:2'-5' RNA ligase